MFTFKNGMTVSQLKKLIKYWPEKYNDGEDAEVWIETGRGLSSPVTEVSRLNVRGDSFDILLESSVFTESE